MGVSSVTVSSFLDLPPPSWESRDAWQRDLEVLISHVCGVSRAGIMAHPDRALSEPESHALAGLAERRRQGEPIAYLTGTRSFWTFELTVGPETLVPRAETECLVTLALARIAPEHPVRVADIGTGCGAIALALARERPRARVVATDVSAKAVHIARSNASALRCDIEFLLGKATAPLSGTFDMIVSNPPYVASGDPCLRGPDLSFEPAIALAGGPDGLDVIRQIAFGARSRLRPGGTLLLEHGSTQQTEVITLLRRYGYTEIEGHPDLSGLPRVVSAVWRPHGG
ncbi:MAG: peptide chain release factor N(5)-glutamine methyltransferase [Acidiferrobacteraceae bacterium]